MTASTSTPTPNASATDAEAVTAIVLCGGRGQRLGGVDKPLLLVAGKPIVMHAIERLSPQVQRILISHAPGNDAYQNLGLDCVADHAAHEGPVAGLAACLSHVKTPWLLTWPGDAPTPPANLTARLAAACGAAGAVSVTAGSRRQNATLLMTRARAAELVAAFTSGARAPRHWLDRESIPSVGFPESDFLDADTQGDLAELEARFRRGREEG
ncbi:MAG: NTP transferase domain-containing protein [Gammaproteobacteria bacterium]|nr:NTP transferase domain-containing protein [Gammaproteobacteria bacterium]